jgi:hypothetical protein
VAYGVDRWAVGNVATGGIGAFVDAGTGAAVVIETTDHEHVIEQIEADTSTEPSAFFWSPLEFEDTSAFSASLRKSVRVSMS